MFSGAQATDSIEDEEDININVSGEPVNLDLEHNWTWSWTSKIHLVFHVSWQQATYNKRGMSGNLVQTQEQKVRRWYQN